MRVVTDVNYKRLKNNKILVTYKPVLTKSKLNFIFILEKKRDHVSR